MQIIDALPADQAAEVVKNFSKKNGPKELRPWVKLMDKALYEIERMKPSARLRKKWWVFLVDDEGCRIVEAGQVHDTRIGMPKVRVYQ